MWNLHTSSYLSLRLTVCREAEVQTFSSLYRTSWSETFLFCVKHDHKSSASILKPDYDGQPQSDYTLDHSCVFCCGTLLSNKLIKGWSSLCAEIRLQPYSDRISFISGVSLGFQSHHVSDVSWTSSPHFWRISPYFTFHNDLCYNSR